MQRDSAAAGRGSGRHQRPCDQCDARWHAISHSIALGVHEGTLRDILHALKYERRTSISSRLAADLQLAAAPVLADADLVVPVPLHPWRAWWRGFNQARLVASGLGLPIVDALARTRQTRRQASLARDDRWQNLAAVIVPRRRRSDRIRGKTVVIVDDIVTTGATVIACAKALKEAGATDVRVVTAARAVRRSPR